MKADSLKISKVFNNGGDILYLLPHFQREYAWEKPNWQTLLKDLFSIYDIYREENPPEHFLGALVVIDDGTRNGTIPAFKLVDGQQRLTTISLILCAFGQLIKEKNTGLYRKIQRMLLNPDEDGLIRFKLLPTTKYGDRLAYLALLQGQSLPQDIDSKIPEAYEYILHELEQKLSRSELDPDRLFIVLTICMQVVFINLDKQERPYEIFESLNAKGKALTQADLVRNYIAMKLPETKQEQVFSQYWSEIEGSLQEKRSVGRSRLGELTAFLRHYLAYHSGVLCNEEHVYARFRDRIEKEFATPDAFISEIGTLKYFADHYDHLLRPEHEPDPDIREALQRLNILEITTAYPFLLACYEGVRMGRLSREEFLESLHILENYIVRRYLAGEPTNYLNKMFPTLSRDVDFSNFGHSLRQVLITKNYPSDSKVHRNVVEEPFYDQRSQTRDKICFVLEMVNRFLSSGSGGHTVLDGAATVEHIMPQTLDTTWKHELGNNWEEIHNDYLDTLGNLTLVTQEWNSSLSNSSFAVKKQKLAQHALRLNSAYFSSDVAHWNADSVQARGEFLAKNILEIWSPLVDSLPSVQAASGATPTAVVILGERIEVDSWRSVAYHTAECVSKVADNFDAIAGQMNTYFRREKFQTNATWQLTNGWWIYLNLSSKSVKTICRNLVAAAGISEDDWQLEFN